MWIRDQGGDYTNTDLVMQIYNYEGRIRAHGGTFGSWILFDGTPEEADRLMKQIGRALASEKAYFDVCDERYKGELL